MQKNSFKTNSFLAFNPSLCLSIHQSQSLEFWVCFFLLVFSLPFEDFTVTHNRWYDFVFLAKVRIFSSATKPLKLTFTTVNQSTISVCFISFVFFLIAQILQSWTNFRDEITSKCWWLSFSRFRLCTKWEMIWDRTNSFFNWFHWWTDSSNEKIWISS